MNAPPTQKQIVAAYELWLATKPKGATQRHLPVQIDTHWDGKPLIQFVPWEDAMAVVNQWLAASE